MFGLWYRQLWAESLGKNGKGTTPVRAMGTVDQHSQLQLYLDGPEDKWFTVIRKMSQGHGTAIQTSDEKLGYLQGRTLGICWMPKRKQLREHWRQKAGRCVSC